jgi:hypothetical protein
VSAAGHDLDAIGAELESAGLRAFSDAYAQVIGDITGYALPPTREEAA